MAAVGGKILCSTCNKASGIMTCRGCGKDFCYRHVAEHRQELNKDMDELATNHDQLQQTITEQVKEPNCHPLMKQIDQWEQQSIKKIQQAADDARKELLIILDTYRTQVVNDLACLTNELNKARHEDDYVETDLKQWTEKLDKLRANLDAGHTIDFSPDNNGAALIPKYYINDASTDVFFEINGKNVQIEQNGKVLVHDPVHELVAARCRGGYSVGQHRFRFRIEHLSFGRGFSCGIVSKSTPMDLIIPTTVVHLRSLNHNVLCFFNDQYLQFQSKCTYEFLIDCNQQTIRLTNEQTRTEEVLNVNLTTFPFPWQFFVTISYGNDRVCLC